MTTHTTNIDGYDVELELDVDYGDGPTTQCTVSRKSDGLGKSVYSASLASLDADGLLNHGSDYVEVPQDTVDAIMKWATINGY